MSSLDDPKLKAVLDRLHAAARGDLKFFLTHIPLMARMLLGRPAPPAAEQSHQFKDVFIPISREQGRFLYLVARSWARSGSWSSAPRSGSRRCMPRRRRATRAAR